MGALSLTASKSTQRKGFGALLGGIEHIPYPYAYRCAHGHTAETCGAEILEQLEGQIFKRLFDPRTSRASSLSPFRAKAVMCPRPSFFLQELQRICRQHGIMFIVDEVQSGMGRTGKWWASEHSGIEPDILCSAKGIASGMPLGAIIRTGKRDALETGRTRHNLWRKPGVSCGSAGHNGPDRERVQGKRSPHGRLPLRAAGRLDQELQDRRRCTRSRTNGRH